MAYPPSCGEGRSAQRSRVGSRVAEFPSAFPPPRTCGLTLPTRERVSRRRCPAGQREVFGAAIVTIKMFRVLPTIRKADMPLHPRYMPGSATRMRTMTGMTRSSDGLDARRRKLLFRSWHRGMREMDLILGGFADRTIDELSDAELDEYEAVLELQDADLLTWITGEQPVPPVHDTAIFRKILASRETMSF
ncbi:FAD assembly factor SdhE [Pseudaminobacter sp. NGMCC 1.201702]|uniref:FAD assembly factor SdhE n=1 Tax=Pseudaminobacter sp. NGMCC 1.201702 TaxID=3391825 RepID=UPI0039F03C37